MKLITKFSEFLDTTVNLNQSRIDTLKSRTDTVQTFIEDSDYGTEIRRFSTQGSWAHKTIIKPVSGSKEFDADMVVFVDEDEDWEAKDYIEDLYKTFKNSSNYKHMVGRKSRCVTLDYSGDFHLDVVPVTVRDRLLSSSTYRVCNRHENEFELSDGDGFKDWWKEKDRLVSNHRLIKATRLIKYIRDMKATFTCKSILMTTLIGNTIDEDDVPLFETTLGEGFEDVPTTLRTVFGRLDDYLQDEEAMPDIKNPVLEKESFTRNWTEDQYQNFRSYIHKYRRWIDEAYEEENRDESIRKWRKLFGDSVAPDVTLKAVQESISALSSPERAHQRSKALELLEAINDDISRGFVDTDKLLRLIRYGIDGFMNWDSIQAVAQENSNRARGNDAQDVATINFYQVQLHRGRSLTPPIRQEIADVIHRHPNNSAFRMCGHILLGTVTRDMADECRRGLWDIDSWPIMRLTRW